MPSNSACLRDDRIGLLSLCRRRQDTTPLQQFPVSLQSPQVGNPYFCYRETPYAGRICHMKSAGQMLVKVELGPGAGARAEKNTDRKFRPR
jgi:hypothetical protein